MTTTKFAITLGATDEEVLDDAAKRILGALENDKTDIRVFPIEAIVTDGELRTQRRQFLIESTDDKILAKAERIDFQKNVSVSVK